ncbi:MAG: phosphatidate cytidylyltransferase [Flavobacteriales bacterium]|nr:phosphatidate cytidylyltransferase [Flavobacteriales bacterium]
MTRILTGITFGLVMISGILYSYQSLVILFALIVFLMTMEYLGLFKMSLAVRIGYAVFAAAALLVIAFKNFFPQSPIILTVVVLTMVSLSVRELYVLKEKSLLFKLPGTFGVLYIFLPFFLLAMIAEHPYLGAQYVMLLFVIVWSSDSLAYFTGKYLGKNKMWPSISPKKTIEGLVGGIVGAVLIALLFSHFTMDAGASWQVAVLAAITALFTTTGDLVESKLKRNLQIKDSGNMLPGHGGILDRFDGVLLAAPIYFLSILFLVYIS